jgi:hypothetical protein
MSHRFAPLAVSSLLALAASAAVAQVAPPPPPAETPEPEFVPPPMPAPRPAAPERRPQQNDSGRITSALPSFPYTPLWRFCGTEDPKVDPVCTFDENLHFAALRPNPTISPGMVPKIQPVIVARRARLEMIVIENLGIVEDVDGGLVEAVQIGAPTELQELLEAIKPLTPPSNLTQELQNRKIISGVQAGWNNKIIQEYQQAYGTYLRENDASNASNRFMQSIFRDSLIESMQAFDGMLHESRTRIDTVLEAVDGVPDAVADKLRAVAIESIEIDPAKVRESAETVKLAWRTLSMDQKTAFLTAVRETRESPNQPPVPMIGVEHAGKTVVMPQDPEKTRVVNSRARNAEQEAEQEAQEDDGQD